MTWHDEVVAANRFDAWLSAIRKSGATITSCRPCPDGFRVIYVTAEP
jgi:hypothetical protein